ncbi:hypothetical protein [uncultured Desulfosarcina sp.]|uniref:hypothetical protein n=1 Tax=uncultured Desulfosarcina sp. TaxID=218289 RepID=UPI0029C7463C|nr:hypothetical protein [uncultured Desulfosarcina sp.]
MRDATVQSPERPTARNLILELAATLVFSAAVVFVAVRFDFPKLVMTAFQRYEALEMEAFIVGSLFLVTALTAFSIRRLVAFRKVNAILVKRNAELEKAMIEIKELRGLIPICSVCKKIRDDEDSWHQIEAYIESHSHAEFTHGICPECMRMLYPGFVVHKNAR